jgi:hypothetical protein
MHAAHQQPHPLHYTSFRHKFQRHLATDPPHIETAKHDTSSVVAPSGATLESRACLRARERRRLVLALRAGMQRVSSSHAQAPQCPECARATVTVCDDASPSVASDGHSHAGRWAAAGAVRARRHPVFTGHPADLPGRRCATDHTNHEAVCMPAVAGCRVTCAH